MSYPGLYRAQVIDAYSNGQATAYVPQLFGDLPITITRFVSYPLTPCMGWVSFEAGESSYPIWMGADVLPVELGTEPAAGDTLDITHSGTSMKVRKATLLSGVQDANGNLIMPTAPGTGVVLGDSTSAAFGWVDLIGDLYPKTTGATTPAITTWLGNIRAFTFTTGDKIDFVYHMPHDWVPGTDLFIHVHWGHNGTNISGSFVMDFYTTFARGFNQAVNGNFSSEVNTTLTVGSLSLTNTPQYRHRTDEIQLSAASPTANQLDTDILEVDGLLLVQGVLTTMPTVTGGVTKPFIFTIDIHYQSHGAGTTINKAPNFYA